MSRYVRNITGKLRAESDRSGCTFPYDEMLIEPGTGLFVHESENDGAYSLARHPQLKAPKVKSEKIGVKNARPLKGNFKDSYLISDYDHSEQPNPDMPLEFQVPMTTEDGSTILIEGYDV